MDGMHDVLVSDSAVATPRSMLRARRRARRLLGPVCAAAMLVAASSVLAPHAGLALWALLPVVAVALIVAGLLGSLADAPAGRFAGRLSTYAAVMGWVWRALSLYAVGLVLFFGTIWLFT